MKITINYLARAQFNRQSIKTTKHAHNSTDNHYELLNTHTIPRTININYCTLTQFHRQLL